MNDDMKEVVFRDVNESCETQDSISSWSQEMNDMISQNQEW